MVIKFILVAVIAIGSIKLSCRVAVAIADYANWKRVASITKKDSGRLIFMAYLRLCAVRAAVVGGESTATIYNIFSDFRNSAGGIGCSVYEPWILDRVDGIITSASMLCSNIGPDTLRLDVEAALSSEIGDLCQLGALIRNNNPVPLPEFIRKLA